MGFSKKQVRFGKIQFPLVWYGTISHLLAVHKQKYKLKIKFNV